MLGNIIADELRITRNWPLAAAISMVITVVSTLCLLVFILRSSKTVGVQPAAGQAEQAELQKLPKGNVA
jgi:spermidine/putrescine transport system permease protein